MSKTGKTEFFTAGGLWAMDAPEGATVEQGRAYAIDNYHGADERDEFVAGVMSVLEPSAKDEGIEPETGEPV